MHPNSLANLRPATKGEVRNPKGINGITKLQHMAELLLEQAVEAQTEGGVSRLAAFIEVWLQQVQRGRPHAQKLFFDRVLPAVERHEHALTEATGASTILDKLTRIAELKRANGGDPESQPERADGGNGDIP